MTKIAGIILLVLLVLTPSVVYAWSAKQEATPIGGASCEADSKSNKNTCHVTIDRYKDGANYCYVARTNNDIPYIAISCVSTNS